METVFLRLRDGGLAAALLAVYIFFVCGWGWVSPKGAAAVKDTIAAGGGRGIEQTAPERKEQAAGVLGASGKTPFEEFPRRVRGPCLWVNIRAFLAANASQAAGRRFFCGGCVLSRASAAHTSAVHQGSGD